jgi:DNA relaxase NicK
LEDRAKKAGINTKWIRNSDRNIGDTLYVGSQTSRVMIRLYEKGKEQRLTGAKRDLWWRAEVQLRPDTKAKQWAYSWSAGMVWGSSRITREFMAYLTGEKLVANNLQVSDMKKGLEDRAAWLVKQYGNLLKELVEETGSWAGVGVMLDRLSEARGTGRIMPKEAGEDECQS